MSASGEIAVPASEQDDGFGDELRMDGGKKKKFKPFQKMRNFFRGGSKKQRFSKEEGAASLKSHSTSALQHLDGVDDDDGGFKTVPKGLAGSRSISEDSIFQPDQQKEQPIGMLHGTAVSMERLSTDFKCELFSKLKGRQSDSDLDDEGISHSPMPILSTEELAFGGRIKSVPVTGKSTNRESDSSLTSVNGPDNDMDQFQLDWKSGVASIATNRSRPSSAESQSDEQMDVKDFEEVQMSAPSLSNEAAKHRISVMPKSRRASSRKSVKKREITATTQLPDVKEESLSKSFLFDKHDLGKDEKVSYTQKAGVSNDISMDGQDKPIVTVIRTTIPIGNPIESAPFSVQRSDPRDIPSRPNTISKDDVDFNRPHSMSPLSTSPLSTAMLQDVKLRSRKVENVENASEQPSEKNELSKALNRAKRISMKYDNGGNIASDKAKSAPQDVTVTVGVKDNEQRKHGIHSKEVSVVKGDKSSPVSPVKEYSPISPSTAGVSYVLKKEPLRPGAKQESALGAKVNGSDNKTDYKPTSVTSSTSEKALKSDTSPKTELKSPDTKSPTKDRLGSPEKLASPKEEYRLKRAARSKTLPEPPAHKEVLNKAKETDQAQTKAENRLGSPPVAIKSRHDYENVMVGARANQPKRASWASETLTTTSAEPSWVVKSRYKQAEQGDKEVEDKKSDKDSAVKNVDVKVSDTNVTEPVVKVAEKSVTFAEKTKDIPSSSVDPKSLGEKPVAQSAMKSWAQTHSAKPFERPSVQSSVKTTVEKTPSVQPSSAKSAFEKSSVHSMKPVVPTQSSSTKSLSTSVKSSVTPQPSTVNKPVSQSAKPAFDISSKPSLQKPNTGLNKSGFEGKTITQNTVKPLVGSNTNIAKSEPIKSHVTSDTRKPTFGVKKLETDTKADAKTTTSSSSISKSSNLNEKANTTQDKPKTESALPAWKQALNQRKGAPSQPSKVKIEIIDKPSKKPEVVKAPDKKIEEKSAVHMRENKPKSTTTEKSCSDAVGNRSSKVLDMVKSFQKMQVT